MVKHQSGDFILMSDYFEEITSFLTEKLLWTLPQKTLNNVNLNLKCCLREMG